MKVSYVSNVLMKCTVYKKGSLIDVDCYGCTFRLTVVDLLKPSGWRWLPHTAHTGFSAQSRVGKGFFHTGDIMIKNFFSGESIKTPTN